eukprot:gene13919-14036_t
MALSEDDLIARYFAPLAGEGAFGLRDDAAQLSPPAGYDIVITKDMLVSGGHFFADDPPFDIARKLMRVNLSDLAAKGAQPWGFLLGLALPQGFSEEWLAGFAAGLAQDAREFGFQLLGGDTVKGPSTLSLTALGLVPSNGMVRRFGAKAEDRLYVTGTIGDAALGLKIRLNRPEDQGWIAALSVQNREFLKDRYLLPRPRNVFGAAMQAYAHAGMDISDGFIGDLRKMMRVSGTSARVNLAQVPLSDAAKATIESAPHVLDIALTGGDDYELLASVPTQNIDSFEAAAQNCGLRLTCIGQVGSANVPEQALFIRQDGTAQIFAQGSFSHF